MPNIEIKAHYPQLNMAKTIAAGLKAEYKGQLYQKDTYFHTKNGRLKLREINNQSAELIPYNKEYSYGPMKSDYCVLPVTDLQITKSLLEKNLGTIAVIEKKRDLYLLNNIRIHLDEVNGLGNFIEFEAVYEENAQEDKMREIEKVNQLIEHFKIKSSDLLDLSYIDYILEK